MKRIAASSPAALSTIWSMAPAPGRCGHEQIGSRRSPSIRNRGGATRQEASVMGMIIRPDEMEAWEEDCLRGRGRKLAGELSHWCYDWDSLPVDETTDEISCCSCWSKAEIDSVKAKSNAKS